MTPRMSRTLAVLLTAALLLTNNPALAQQTREERAAAEAARKQEEKDRKEREKTEKAAREAEEKRLKELADKNFDIENIGNRDINSGGFHPMTPDLEAEIAMGRAYSREIEQSVNLVTDPVVTEYVNRVGQNIVRNSDAKVPFTIKVIDSDEINAMSLPGGFFYVNTGLIQAADEEAELAAVMAHEIAHVTARHSAEQQGRASFLNILAIPASILTGGIVGMAVQQTLGLILPATLYKFDRNAEEEADALGLQYMYKAGYDPGASVSFFEKLQARETAKRKISGLFATHPQTEDRVAATKENIEMYLPAREQYLVTTSEFQRVKTLLTQVQERRNPSERDEGPSLRRPAPSRRNPDDADAETTADPDDREPDPDAPPVLRRPQDRPQ